MRGTRIRNVLLLLLACTAGGVDALSYVGLGRVFTANMTGNTVLLGLALGQAELQAVVRSGLALTGFLAGVALGAWTTNRGLRGGIWTPAVTVALTMEWFLLVAWAVGWYFAGDLETNQLVRDALIMVSALAMGIQSAVGRRLNISGVATTYITGTLTSLITRLVDRGSAPPTSQAGHERATPGASPQEPGTSLLAATWAIYIGGAAGAAMAASSLGPLPALAFPIAILTVVSLTASMAFRRP